MRLHPKIGDHDRDRLMTRAAEFLDKGDKVQLTMIFRGRERFHQDLGQSVFNAIIQKLGENVKVERPVRNEGRRMTMVLAPGVKKPAGPSVAAKPASAPKKPRPEAVAVAVAQPQPQPAAVADVPQVAEQQPTS